MAFDKSTRNRLLKFVGEARALLCGTYDKPGGEITRLLQRYGIQPDGHIEDLDKIPNLTQQQFEEAAILRDILHHKRADGVSTKTWGHDPHVYDLIQEQGFTVLNRLCAVRMAEARGVIIPCVAQGIDSDGFQLFDQHTDKLSASRDERYCSFLFSVFDELSVDLHPVFDRYSPQGILFPGPEALVQLLDLLNALDLQPFWSEDETIGWIYQYWNSQQERQAIRKAGGPRNSRQLAIINQFFTPRYVVEFLTDNTLGRIWYEMTCGQTRLAGHCRYLVRRPTEIFLAEGEAPPVEDKEPVTKNKELSQEELLRAPIHIPHRPLRDPLQIRLLDPACGSMHFGLYAFDLFEVVYDEAWEIVKSGSLPAGADSSFSEFIRLVAAFPSKQEFLREVPRLIIEQNLHGIEIDPRAAQIAALSLWLRAHRSWQTQRVPSANRPSVRRSNVVCAEPMPGEKDLLAAFVVESFPSSEQGFFQKLLENVFEKMMLAGDAGSLLRIEEDIRSLVEDARENWQRLGKRSGEFFSEAELALGDKRAGSQYQLDLGSWSLADLSGIPSAEFWDRAEERIYAALRAFAEHTDRGKGFQRRLFATDAARGFAFIDLCRQRYDAVVMNPPFGEWSAKYKPHSKASYPVSYNDILAAFVERGGQFLVPGGRLGAITSRTCFFLSSFTRWRDEVVLGQLHPELLVDLGHGVMDTAMVEAAAYVLAKPTC